MVVINKLPNYFCRELNYSRTSRYGHLSNYGQFPMSRQKILTYFLKKEKPSLIRTTDTKSGPQRENSYKLDLFIADSALIR